MRDPAAVDAFITALPKVELHVHLEGSLQPATLLTLARKHRLDHLPTSLEAVRRWYAFRDFAHFTDVYETALQVLGDADDFARLVTETAAELAVQNVHYAEIIITPMHHLGRGVPAQEFFSGLERGRARAEREYGVRIRWIVDFAGHGDPTKGQTTLDAVLAAGAGSVIGFSVGGVEVERDQFRDVFARARAHGLHSIPHAGEAAGPDRIWAAIRALRADRIGHGIACLRDPQLVAYVREIQLPLDVCPTSNLRTGAVPELSPHPLPAMLAAGLMVTLNSDDPPMFNTDLTGEYRTAYRLGLGAHDLAKLARNGVRASFLEPDPKTALLRKIEEVTAAFLGNDG